MDGYECHGCGGATYLVMGGVHVFSPTGIRVTEELKLKHLNHRKHWEYIVSALERFDMLRPGRRGLVLRRGTSRLYPTLLRKGWR
jgi:hypothetical protein